MTPSTSPSLAVLPTAAKTATFVRSIEKSRGDGRLYRLSVPVPYGRTWDDNGDPLPDSARPSATFVIVSAVSVPYTGPETYIFAADETGKVLDWGELPGSFRGAFDHTEALRGLGFAAVGSPVGPF